MFYINKFNDLTINNKATLLWIAESLNFFYSYILSHYLTRYVLILYILLHSFSKKYSCDYIQY